MLCNPSRSLPSVGGVTVGVFARLFGCSCLLCFVKLFFKHYHNWDPSTIVPKQHFSEKHATTPPHVLKLKSTFCSLVSVACALTVCIIVL